MAVSTRAVRGSSRPESDGRADRWRAHNARRRDEVLDAAIAVIDEDGVHVPVQRIADRLGLPRPVVYRHFGGRVDLDEQIRKRILNMLLSEVVPALRPDGTVGQTVRHAIGTYVHWIERHPNLHQFLGVRAATSPALTGARSAIATQLAELFTAALRRFDADTALAGPMAFGVMGLVDGVVNSWRRLPDANAETAQVENMLTRSLLVLLDANAHDLGIALSADTPVSELFDEVPAFGGDR